MARTDVVDLKSFQKISLSEVRYLSEIDCSKKSLMPVVEKTAAERVQELKARMSSGCDYLRKQARALLHNLIYETVPVRDTYSASAE